MTKSLNFFCIVLVDLMMEDSVQVINNKYIIQMLANANH